MVKARRGKRDVAKDEEMDSDVDVAKDTAAAGSDAEDVSTAKARKVKKEKKKAPKRDEDEDGDEDGTKAPPKGEEKSKGKKGDSEDDEEVAVIAPGRGKKGKKGGFALLNVDSDNDVDSDGRMSEEEDVAPKPKKKGKDTKRQDSVEEDVPKEPQGGKKSKKSKKKRNEDDEEDIEKLLAELQIEYAGGKSAGSSEAAADAGDSQAERKKKFAGKGREHKQSFSKQVDELLDDDFKADNDVEEELSTVKTAAQKKKEKKERQKREAAAAKLKTGQDEEKLPQEVPQEVPPQEDTEEAPGAENEDEKKEEKKKKRKEKREKPEKAEKADGEKGKDEKGKKGPGKHLVAAMQERLKKLKEEEERMKREEEERIRILEEAERQRQEQIQLEQERKEKKKQKEKERKERLKAEGKLLTLKQKQEKARAQAMLEALKAQGVEVPEAGKKAPRLGTRVRTKKKDQMGADVEEKKESSPDEKPDVQEQTEKEEKDTVKDAWDATSSEDESEEVKAQEKPAQEASEESESEEESEEEESESESESDPDDHRTDAERKREKARARIEKRRVEAEKKRTQENLRAAVVCVLGHVDTGKTKILDKLRRTHVQDSEAGGITQQIGATNVPIDAIKEQTRFVKGAQELDYKLPGLLIIDTPGHESFSNLRSRGSSLCDIAILVVDIMHGLEPQTIESLNLLKTRKTPFIVALNKIDRLYDWGTMGRKDVRDVIKGQPENTQMEFHTRVKEVITQFAEQGLNAALFYDNPDVKSYVSLVPTSAITGEGMGNLLYLIVESCQNLLTRRLMYSEDLQATVLEVKAIPGLGTTIDAILINGKLREGQTMILAGTEGPIVTQIRSLLMPQPLKELRVKNAYIEYKEIVAAQGVKIAAKELEKAIAGLNLQVAQKPDEVEILKEEVAKELKSALSSIKLSERGVYVQASTLGSLEALLEFLRTSKIPYAGIRIGPVVKRDVMKASTMLEHEPQYATILAFDVKVERDAQDLADSLGVKIFQADIIYHLFDKFMAYREELKQKKRDEFKSIAVFPCKLKVLPQFIFNSRDPIVIGVMVENGIIREGTPICVPSKEFVELGIVTSIESNHKQIESARKGQEVCIKIEPLPGETPKMFGRHFEETDMLVSKISRQSIDACKDYFRDDLIKADWALMVELKKLFQIL
ncbi:eukaryotic translation initiation factor 5B isoform X1 [Lutzomyia longipalpis]|uniref:eukaryotic translation initiation factor 5B isoform X1 n=1 Tax=Lutzomyia longipalpis TaxID=7200 RepID=UPI0024837F77|nr:eukaryotic translation initiation factor 5B isoform X1 [Lutzomyia longipalpis]